MAARTADGVFSITPCSSSCSPRWATGRAISQSRLVHMVWEILAWKLPRSRELERALDLDRGVHRQSGNADRGTRVFAFIAKYLDHQIGSAVHHLRAIRKAGGGIDEAAEPH